MIEYRKPCCRGLAFLADAPLEGGPVRMKCDRCKVVVTPRVTGPLYAEDRCPDCGALGVRILAHDALPSMCVPCGVRMVPEGDRADRTNEPHRVPERASAA